VPLPNDNIPSHVIPKILYDLREELKVQLIDGVPEDSPNRAMLVKVGRFQENPTDVNISVAISAGDYEDPDYIDGRIDHPDLRDLRIRNLPVGEIGGGIYWWRRFSVLSSVFFVRQNFEEEVALQHAYEFLGRLQKSIEAKQFSLEDDFGEIAKGKPFIESTTFFESGGKNKWIFRGKLRFRVLTWRP
jgi:hypothetical protein